MALVDNSAVTFTVNSTVFTDLLKTSITLLRKQSLCFTMLQAFNTIKSKSTWSSNENETLQHQSKSRHKAKTSSAGAHRCRSGSVRRLALCWSSPFIFFSPTLSHQLCYLLHTSHTSKIGQSNWEDFHVFIVSTLLSITFGISCVVVCLAVCFILLLIHLHLLGISILLLLFCLQNRYQDFYLSQLTDILFQLILF